MHVVDSSAGDPPRRPSMIIHEGHTSLVSSVAFSPDGKWVISGSEDNTVRTWDANSSSRIGEPLRGHSNSIHSVSYSPLGNLIASASEDKTIHLWDPSTGQQSGEALKGASPFLSVSFSPDAKLIASGSAGYYSSSTGCAIQLWDVQTRKAASAPFKGHIHYVWSISFSPDGTRLVSGSYDKTIRVWDVERERAILSPWAHSGAVRSTAFSPDGSQILSCSHDATIRFWDARTGATIGKPYEGHTGQVYSVAFSPSGIYLASGGHDKTVRLWDIRTGRQVNEPLEHHTDIVKSVAYSPYGIYIASGSWDRKVIVKSVWGGGPDPDDGAGPQTVTRNMSTEQIFERLPSAGCVDLSSKMDPRKEAAMIVHEGHTDRVRSVAFSPDSKWVISGSEDNTVRMWDAQGSPPIGGPLRGHNHWISSVSYSPLGNLIASGSYDNTIRLWDTNTGQQSGAALKGNDAFLSVAFSPNAKFIASGSAGPSFASMANVVQLWDVQMRKAASSPFEGHSGQVWTVSFSPDSTRLVSGASDKTIRIWDIEWGVTITGPLEGHTNYVRSTGFSPDGTQIVSCSIDGTIRFWDARTGGTIGKPYKGHIGQVYSVALSPCGTYVASGGHDKTVRLWDVRIGRQVDEPFEDHTDAVKSVAYSPCGLYIASGSWDRKVIIRRVLDGGSDPDDGVGPQTVTSNTSTQQMSERPPSAGSIDLSSQMDSRRIAAIVVHEGQTRSVHSVAFSPNGKSVVSGSGDCTVQMWDAISSSLKVGPLIGHRGMVYSVSYSPLGNLIASGSDDKTIRLWDTSMRQQSGEALKGDHTFYSVAFSPNAKFIASGCGGPFSSSTGRAIQLWDVQTRRAMPATFKGHLGYVWSVSFSPEGAWLASGSDDKTIRIWDVEREAAIVGPLEGHADWVRSTVFSPDGAHIASCSYDRTIRFWDARSGGTIGKPYRGHTGYVYSVAFSPCGIYVASGGRDKTVRLWDVRTGRQVDQPFDEHTGEVNAVAFSPCGRYIASGSDDCKVIIRRVLGGDHEPDDTAEPQTVTSQMSTQQMFECLCRAGCVDLSSQMDIKQETAMIASGGGFGDIWKGKLNNGGKVAIKAWRTSALGQCEYKTIKRAARELHLWSKMDHPHIHRLQGVILFRDQYLGMVSEWMDNGNLHEYLRRHSGADRYQLVASGLDYMHSRGTIHGDLKALNVLVSPEGTARLSDFDFSIMSEATDLIFTASSNTRSGSVRWVAPEMLAEETPKRTTQSDVYALGMTMLEIFTGKVPYPERRLDAAVIMAVMQGILPTRPVEHLKDDEQGSLVWNLLVKCWSREMNERPSARQILEVLESHTER